MATFHWAVKKIALISVTTLSYAGMHTFIHLELNHYVSIRLLQVQSWYADRHPPHRVTLTSVEGKNHLREHKRQRLQVSVEHNQMPTRVATTPLAFKQMTPHWVNAECANYTHCQDNTLHTVYWCVCVCVCACTHKQNNIGKSWVEGSTYCSVHI